MTILTIFMLMQMPGPRDILNLLARPPGIFCCAKALGLGTHFGAKAPGCPGGMVTSQIDTCINALSPCTCPPNRPPPMCKRPRENPKTSLNFALRLQVFYSFFMSKTDGTAKFFKSFKVLNLNID